MGLCLDTDSANKQLDNGEALS